MENFYKKYSKPIFPLTYENVIVHLENYTNILKEYLESLIFIKNELKSDFLKYKNSEKNEIFPLLENFKNTILIILEKIQNFLSEKYNSNKKEITKKEFSNIEFIRENFNSILLNLTKFFIDFDFLEKIRKKFVNLNQKINIKTSTDFDIVDETKNNNFNNIKPFVNVLNSVKTNNELINISNQKLLKKFDLNLKNIKKNFCENSKNNKKINNENFSLKNEIFNLQNQINDLNFKYKTLQENFDSLKNENISLKKQNFYLIEYINKNKIKK